MSSTCLAVAKSRVAHLVLSGLNSRRSRWGYTVVQIMQILKLEALSLYPPVDNIPFLTKKISVASLFVL